MTKTLILASVGTLFLAGAAVSQTIVESAVSAAGGTAAGVAGKKVSEGIDSVFGKVSGITKAAADTGKKDERHRLAAPIPPLPSIPGSAEAPNATPRTAIRRQAAVAPGTRSAKSAGANAASHPEPVPSTEAQTPAAVVAPPPPPRNLNELSNGSSRDEVIGKWGKPAGRLTMSNDDGLVEVYKYPEGSVRIVNGTVTEIRPKQP